MSVGKYEWPLLFHSELHLIPLFHRAFGSSFTRRKQGLFLLVTYGRQLCHSLMNLICVCRLSGQCMTCRAWYDEVKMSDDGTKCRSDTDLIVDKHKSDSSDHDTIVFHRWPEEINLASDEWRMSQKLCGTGV